MRTPPIIHSIRILTSHPQRSTGILYGVFFLVFCVLIGVGVSPYIQKTMMRKFHFMPRPFAQWALLQFVPSMYNFRNDFFASTQPMAVNAQMEGKKEVLHFTVNHYPLRMWYFYYSRKPLILSIPVYANIRTTFRDQEITSSYMMASSPKVTRIHFLNAYEHSYHK